MRFVVVALAAGLACADTNTTVYTLQGVSQTGDCAEVDLPTADVKKAQAFDKDLVVGHCADKGFSVADGTTTRHVPALGDLTVRKYKKAGDSSHDAKWSHAGDVAQSQGVDCSQSKCPSECQCAQSKCADSINSCLADPTCAKGQSCALSCACGDKACAIKCVLANPSDKAKAVGKCIEAKCAKSEVAQIQGVDCSQSKCPTECQCAQSKCADSINSCLADPTCAKGQSCALSCACGDKACAIKCALANPSDKAKAVGKCIEAKCANSVIVV